MSSDQVQVEIDKIGRECLCLQSRMTTRAITRRYNAVLTPIGLEVTEFSLLAALHVGTHLASARFLGERDTAMAQSLPRPPSTWSLATTTKDVDGDTELRPDPHRQDELNEDELGPQEPSVGRELRGRSKQIGRAHV